MLRVMQNAKDLHALESWLEAVNHDKGCSADDQLACAALAAGAAQLGMLNQLRDLMFEAIALLDRGQGRFMGDVRELVTPVPDRGRQPDERQAAVPFARLISSARCAAQSFLASSCDTHCTWGSSASWSASSTWARNQRS